MTTDVKHVIIKKTIPLFLIVAFAGYFIYAQQQGKGEINLIPPSEIAGSNDNEIIVIYKFPELNIIKPPYPGRISVTYFIDLSGFDTLEYIELKGKVSKDSLSAIGDYLFDLPWFPIYGTLPDNGIVVGIGDTVKKIKAGEEFSHKVQGINADIFFAKGINPIVFESCGMSGDKKLNITYLRNDARLGIKDVELIIKGKVQPQYFDKYIEDVVVSGARNNICSSYGSSGKFCTDVVIDAYKNIGVELPPVTRDAYRMYLYFKDKGRLVDKNVEWQKGDVIFWDTTSDWSGPVAGKVHVGVYGGIGNIIEGKENSAVCGKIIFHASSSALHPIKQTRGHVRGVLLWSESKKDGRIIGIGRW